MNFSDFEKIFQGVLLFFIPTKNIEKQTKISTHQILKNIIISHKKHYIKLFIETIMILILSFIHLYLIKELINQVNFINYHIFFLCIILIVVKNSLEYFRKIKILQINVDIDQEFIEDTFEKILLLPYQYYRNRTTGEIVSRVEDANRIGQFISICIVFTTNLCLCILSGILLYNIHYTLVLIAILLCIISLIVFKYFEPKIKTTMNLTKQLKSEVDSFLVETVSGFESVKGTNSESFFFQKFRLKYQSYLKQIRNYELIKMKEENISQNIEELGLLVILLFGLILVQKNILNFGELLIISTLIPYFIKPCLEFTQFNSEIHEILTSIRRVLELQKVKQSKESIGKIINLKFKNVKYCYHKNNTILKDINLEISNHNKSMIVGPSGKGKSTILKLIKQYYETDNIFVNNLDSKNQNISAHVVYISQNEFLFTDTLYNNITLGKTISSKKMSRIIQICSLESIIEKSPLGIHQIIEENGFNLSGGERQRIVLARALLNHFQILLIDEGLSQVDISLERKILKNLFKYFNNKTILFVSHRLENNDLFDQLIKVDDSVQVFFKNNS